MPRRSALLLAVSLCALSASAREYGEGEPVREDPRARIRERIRQFGQRTPEEGLAFLQTARAEAEKVGLDGSTTHRLAARGTSLSAAQGKTWINLGPTNASFEKNGITYTKVDSGRVRRVLVHPTDPNIIYVATAGGGVWKTFDGTTPVSDLPGGSTGPTWRPITESVGSLSVGSMAMDPKNPDILVLGLGDPFDNQFPGLVHSSDGEPHGSRSACGPLSPRNQAMNAIRIPAARMKAPTV